MVRWGREERRKAIRRARAASLAGARTSFAAKPLTWIGVVLAVLVLAVAGLFGGLRERHDAPAHPVLAVGAAVDAGPWRVTVQRARSLDELDGAYLTDPAENRWFAVVATITVIDDVPNAEVGVALEPRGVESLRLDDRGRVVAPQVLRLSDGQPLGVLNPGITEDVAFLWEQAKSAPVPTEVTLDVGAPARRRDSFSTALVWKYGERTIVGSVTVDVKRVETTAGGG